MSNEHAPRAASARAPHEETFEQLVRLHRDELTRFAARMLGAHAGLAEDVVQEALINAHRAILAGTSPEHPRAWLFTIVRNAAVNAARAAKPTEAIEEPKHASVEQSVAATVEQGEWIDWLMSAVGGLPARQREALVGHAFEGRSYSEIAARQQTTVSAVKSLIGRARRALAGESSFSTVGVAALLVRVARGMRGLLARGPVAGKAGGAKGLLGVLAQAALAATVTTGVLMAVHGGGLGAVLASTGPRHLATHERPARAQKPSARHRGEGPRARERRIHRESAHAVRECRHGRVRRRYREDALLYAARHLPTVALEYTECRQVLSSIALGAGTRRRPPRNAYRRGSRHRPRPRS